MQDTAVFSEIPKRDARRQLSEAIAARVDRAKFNRYCDAALIPRDRAFYGDREMWKLLFVARYLQQDRSLARARNALIQALSQEDDDNGSHG